MRSFCGVEFKSFVQFLGKNRARSRQDFCMDFGGAVLRV